MDPSLINPGHWTRDLLEAQGFNDTLIAGITISVDFIVLVLASLLADYVAKSILLRIIKRWVLRTAATWDDHFLSIFCDFETSRKKNLLDAKALPLSGPPDSPQHTDVKRKRIN